MIGPEGTLVIVGLPATSATVTLPVTQFIFGGPRRIMGSSMGSTRLSVDVPRLVELYQQGRLKLDELITARYPLEQINEAINRNYGQMDGESVDSMLQEFTDTAIDFTETEDDNDADALALLHYGLEQHWGTAKPVFEI